MVLGFMGFLLGALLGTAILLRIRVKEVENDVDILEHKLSDLESRFNDLKHSWSGAARPRKKPLVMPTSITCPKCKKTSHHPGDIQAGYCGSCSWWTSDPVLSSLDPDSLKDGLQITKEFKIKKAPKYR